MVKTNYQYAIQHSFKKEVIIPIEALYHNFDFFFIDNNDKYVRTSDGYTCKVMKWEEVHICDLENDIKRLYGLNMWDYIKRWYNACPQMNSMYFLKLELDNEGFN